MGGAAGLSLHLRIRAAASGVSFQAGVIKATLTEDIWLSAMWPDSSGTVSRNRLQRTQSGTVFNLSHHRN